VDLFLLHSPPRAVLEAEPDIWECLERIKLRGLAKGVGVSVRSPEDGLEVASLHRVDAIEVNYNLADQRAVQIGLFDRCRERGIGIIVRTPLCFGFLTGAYGGQEGFDAADHRSRWSPEQRARWNEAQASFWNHSSGLAEQTPAQFALRFCLSHPAVSTVIPGMLTVEHVEENTRASDLGPLSAEGLDRIRALYDGQEFFLGR
jgi:aryl-alcohol dehydrogenase-like predicted oxidoreductase